MSSLDLSEFFNDDDSNGHRLAEFLQKRRGGVQRPKFLYLNSETKRKSLKVKLEKLPQTQIENNENKADEKAENKTNEGQIPQQKEIAKHIERYQTVEEQVAAVHGESDRMSSVPSKSQSPRLSPPPPASAPPPKSSPPPTSAPPPKSSPPPTSTAPPKSPPLLTSRPITPPPPMSLPPQSSPPLVTLSPTPGSSPIPKSPPDASAVNASGNNVNSSEPPLSPIIPFITTKPPSPTRPVSPSRSLSPRLSALRKSGGRISPGDSLRRLSLKRLTTKVHGGRRTLLREFENTVNDENFQPPLFSTPLSQQSIVIPTSPSSSPSPSPHLETEILKPNTSDKPLPTITETCCGHTNTLIQTLQRREEELNEMMASLKNQSSMSNKTSPLKRTYTIEKGQSPGQVILTPDRTPADKSLQQRPTPSKIVRTSERFANRSIISISVKSPNNLLNSPQNRLSKSLSQNLAESPRRSMRRSSIMLEKAITPKSTDLLNSSSPNLTTNISIINPTQEPMDIEIPETQEQPLTENENCIRIESNSSPVVVIPINRSHNQSYMEQTDYSTIITAKPKSLKTKSKSPSPMATNVDKIQNIPDDQLKLTDIFTDDEEDLTPKAVSYSKKNDNQAPLNLASSATNVRTKRLRKRSILRRRLHMDHSQLLSTETETEPPPAAHTSNNTQQRRRVLKRSNLPMNRAPGTPLNGERFAVELQRMSNYEILDLRKRNSMGLVFPISGRKSTSAQKEANKKQLQLDDRIEMELLRRSLNKSVNDEVEKRTENVNTTEEYPPVPDQFRDEQQEEQQLKTSLIDEKSTDRISFKPCTSLKITRKRRAKSVPDVLKQYLEATKLFKTKKKSRKSKINTTKRSLYTQGNSDSEEFNANNSNEKQGLQTSVKRKSDISLNKTQTPRKMETRKKSSLPIIPSPPVSETDQMPELRIISPPPPLTISFGAPLEEREEVETTEVVVDPYVEQQIEEFLPPPPPEFDSDSGVSSNNLNIQKPVEETTINANDDVFKKPLPPPPAKKKSTKKYKDNTLLNDMQATQENNPDTTIRRSKRQVSETKPLSIFQILYQENLNRRFQAMEKQQARLKQKKREGRIKKLPTLAEDDVMTALHNDMEILQTKKPSKTKSKSKVIRKNSKTKQQQRTFEQLESSKINLTVSPPVDHFNNVFDQLSIKAREENCSERPASSLSQQNNNIKKLEVRLKRFKTGNLSTANQHSRTTSSQANNQLVDVNSTTNTFSSVSSSTVGGSNQSNFELISWLKNVTEAESCDTNEEIFKEMRISAASNLSFSTIQGVEYAFYDTDDKASLGYLRFKPGQIKSKKKAKRYNLHFVTLVGQFRITANDKEKCVGVGDMVAIEKSVYYDIENITNDIGILMVIKK